jgi:hypothetical protein
MAVVQPGRHFSRWPLFSRNECFLPKHDRKLDDDTYP